MSGKKRWFITGVSGGLGRLLAEAVLARGDSVVGTMRRPEQISEFEALAPDRAHGVMLDVTHRTRIAPAVAEGVAWLGGLDYLVNNAGYGLVGALEELDEDQIVHVLETNLFGTIFGIRAALPALRESGGTIVNLSSLAGLVAIQGSSTYCAAKFGVEGLSECLRMELTPLGVGIMVVEPGGVHTSFATSSIQTCRNPMPEYSETPAGQARAFLLSGEYKARGDANKVVAAILKALDAPDPPFRLLLGPDALKQVRSKMSDLNENIAAWEDTTLSTDFDAP